jgi:predicted nucleic acid-binding protein
MIVVDASIWVSYLVRQDVHHALSQSWLTTILKKQIPIAAPIILLSEIGGAISRRLGHADLGNKAINQLLAVPTLRLVAVEHSLGIQASRIAANYQLRGADALYVTVAQQLNIPLISWDNEHLTRTSGLITTYTPATHPLRD